ncbi:hypothetical protein GCM10023094_41380 [Rhodococcus olei]|uniref:Dehydratase n=1 Tax=Rhodococcus olei TaxID=2161675 RepID=A0ABP8PDQ3_9NOCA
MSLRSSATARGVAAPLTAGAFLAGTMLLGSPAFAADTTVDFQNACHARAILPQDISNPFGFTIDAPEAAAVGQEVSYTLQPAPGSLPDKESIATTTDLQRLKLDIDVPANAELVTAELLAGTGKGLGGTAPSVTRIDADGNPDQAGQYLRISGGNETVGNGPNSSADTAGGISVPKTKTDLAGNPTADGSTQFQLPAVRVTVKPVAEGVITPRVRTAGDAGTYDNEANYYTFLARAQAFGSNFNAPSFCIPKDGTKPASDTPFNAGGKALATITVGKGGNPDPDPEPEPGTGGSSGLGSLGETFGS